MGIKKKSSVNPGCTVPLSPGLIKRFICGIFEIDSKFYDVDSDSSIATSRVFSSFPLE